MIMGLCHIKDDCGEYQLLRENLTPKTPALPSPMGLGASGTKDKSEGKTGPTCSLFPVYFGQI